MARGVPVREAALEACELRFRPIVMTSFAFILGVVPLAVATGDEFVAALLRDIPPAPADQAAIVAANRAGRPLAAAR